MQTKKDNYLEWLPRHLICQLIDREVGYIFLDMRIIGFAVVITGFICWWLQLSVASVGAISPTPTIIFTPTPATFPPLQLSEISACPTEGGEWVEIVNPALTPAPLANWKLMDSQGVIASYALEQIIEGQMVLVIDLTSQKLNNSGDSVALIRPDGVIADNFTYSACESGIFYAKTQNQWGASLTHSKNLLNPILIPTASVQPTLPVFSPTPTILATPTNNPVSENRVSNIDVTIPTPTVGMSPLIWPTLPAAYPISTLRLTEPNQISKEVSLSGQVTAEIPTIKKQVDLNQNDVQFEKMSQTLLTGAISAILGGIFWILGAGIAYRSLKDFPA